MQTLENAFRHFDISTAKLEDADGRIRDHADSKYSNLPRFYFHLSQFLQWWEIDLLECAGRRYSVCSALSRINQMLNTISLPDTYFEGNGSDEAVVL